MKLFSCRFLLRMACLVGLFSGSATKGKLFSQETSSTNPVIFLNMGTGPAFGEAGGIFGVGTFSVQFKKVLIAARLLESGSFGLRPIYFSPVTAVPVVYNKHNMREGALLAGPRWVFQHSGLSVQAGISRNRFTQSYTENNFTTLKTHFYTGLPFEITYLYFNGIRKRYRFYQLLPLSRKPVAFGNGFGFSLSGNIAQHSYVGLGLILGFGFYKKY